MHSNIYSSSPSLLNEEQRKKLKDLHIIQQRQLDQLIKKHQQEQLELFQRLNEEEQDSKAQILNESMKQSNVYKPYTLNQYKQLKLQPILKNAGQGLGPTMSIEEWQHSKEKQERMQEFAEEVKLKHRHLRVGPPRSQPKQQLITVRQKGIEFAKHILKPIVATRQISSHHKESENEDELLQYEQRNKALKDLIGRIK